jgi:thymidylate synthase
MLKTSDIKQLLVDKYKNNDFRITKGGVKTVELQGIQFEADADHILREPNYDYAKREIEWYISQSLNVNDIPGNTPSIWLNCADVNGDINSNYGWMIWSKENGSQYNNCLYQLINDPATRQAVMIYNRPSMYVDAYSNMKHDFCCTYSVQCFLNPVFKKYESEIPLPVGMLPDVESYTLDYHVFMRSNDAVFGYNNDVLWHKYVHESMVNDMKEIGMNVELGKIIWNAGSLHVYERHFKFLE